mmetsp:Transcript_18719/g.31999  ORF Transcript_18719/g.31999 Transcript_18719/m.31999 type:complete len:122 (-) Transcript_18719:83-448(-)
MKSFGVVVVLATVLSVAVGFAPSASRPAFAASTSSTLLNVRRVSGGPKSTKAPSAEVDMDWTIEVIRDIMREEDLPVSEDIPTTDRSFFDDWRNDPERADLVAALPEDQQSGGPVPPHPLD